MFYTDAVNTVVAFTSLCGTNVAISTGPGGAALAGIGAAGTWSADRPYMSRLTPPDRVDEIYGLDGMVGRLPARRCSRG